MYYASFLGGRAKATALCSKCPLCDPSQKGLLLERPHLQRETTVRPPRSYTLPSLSTISKSPSMRVDPLLLITSFVVAIISLVCGKNKDNQRLVSFKIAVTF